MVYCINGGFHRGRGRIYVEIYGVQFAPAQPKGITLSGVNCNKRLLRVHSIDPIPFILEKE